MGGGGGGGVKALVDGCAKNASLFTCSLKYLHLFPAGRVDGKLMNVLDGFNGFNVVHSFSRIKDVTINTTKVNKLIFVTFISFISIHGKSLVIR